MKRYFLGMAANYNLKNRLEHTFTIGTRKDCNNLRQFLEKKYGGEAVLCKNGRSALALALKAYFKPGDEIIVNGFTCYAVCEAIKAAKLVPRFADISREDLNFGVDEITHANLAENSPEEKSGTSPRLRGIIIQNTLGNPVDIEKIENYAKEHNLLIIEDLAHSAGIKYPDGREAGTVGVATVLSFGKDKAIDTVSGGAVIMRSPGRELIQAPSKLPRPSDHFRARFYPAFGALCRKLTYVHLGGAMMRLLVKIRFVEKSADNRLDPERKMSKFEAKLALKQLKALGSSRNKPIRDFCFVNNREEVLKELKKQGYYFDGFWYERPISPKRYYKKVHFPEEKCPNALFASQHIINLPTYYKKSELESAYKIIKRYLIEEERG